MIDVLVRTSNASRSPGRHDDGNTDCIAQGVMSGLDLNPGLVILVRED
jgi:hypothetical protein